MERFQKTMSPFAKDSHLVSPSCHASPRNSVRIEYVRDLDADVHPGLPRCHREREALARNRNRRSRWALHLATRKGAERRLELTQQFVRIERLSHLRFAQADDFLRPLRDHPSDQSAQRTKISVSTAIWRKRAGEKRDVEWV